MKLEHLIYGTFPDLPGSQQVVYKSSGITPELESWLISRYDAFGDCRTEEFQSSLTMQWYRTEETTLGTLTKVSHAGKDFSGRWGALLRHTAIFSLEQCRELKGALSGVAGLLVSGGNSEELAQSGDLEIEAGTDSQAPHEWLSSLNLANYQSNLARLLTGERLVLYSDLNTSHLNQYLQTLIRLTPLNIRERLNWSEFVFHSLPELDLSVVHSSRYSAPESEAIEFQTDGENALSDLRLSGEEAEAYLSALDLAIKEGARDELERLLGFVVQPPVDESPE
jgi:hypothetical protein